MEIVLRDADDGRWLSFNRPLHVISARRVGEVVGALEEIELAVERDGLTAVGFVAYEAAPAFDRAFRTHRPAERIPLLCFGLYEEAIPTSELPFDRPGRHTIGEWKPTQSAADHHESVRRIRGRIARGDTYQVNHTFRLRASFDGDPRGFFRRLVRSQPKSFAAYLDMDDLVICSASPELFFRLDGNRLISKPMKGTARRGWSLESDRAQEEWLAASEKNRAENAMIVDMVRNDLGRVAREGSVDVPRSFDVERHPTLYQMTSTVAAETDASVAEIMAAAFPFASVTGAPKIRTMDLIRELETEPRGVYTGAIGLVAPGRRARFSVAIRTSVVERTSGIIEYGVGSGIVWDSVAEDEYGECVTKAGILSAPTPDFELLETILWEADGGFALLDRHLGRLAGGAEYFGRDCDRSRIRSDLELRAEKFANHDHRVRLLVAADGSHRIEALPLDSVSRTAPVRLGLAASAVKREDPFLHFKTTQREVYERARASRPECDDVLLWNDRGEVTESTIANLVAKIDDEMVTPRVECGLLAGAFRAELLEREEIVEGVILVDQLVKAEALFLINSVQGWRDVAWVDP